MNTRYHVGDKVKKVTGDYRIKGVVRAVFTLAEHGPTRYVVRHEASGGGYFGHIYGDENLVLDVDDQPPNILQAIYAGIMCPYPHHKLLACGAHCPDHPWIPNLDQKTPVNPL